MNQKTQPNDPAAEISILGGILINQQAIEQVIEIISPTDFYLQKNEILFKNMIKLYQAGSSIDLITLTDSIEKSNVKINVDWDEYIISIIEGVAVSAGIAEHARIVKNLSLRRQLMIECSSISENCAKKSEDLDAVLEQAGQAISKLAEGKTTSEPVTFDQVVDETMTSVKSKKVYGGGLTGIPTGFKELDRRTAGLQKSDLIIAAARPGVGKSALAANIAVKASNIKPVVIFSLEMARLQLGYRMVSAEMEIPLKQLRKGLLKRPEWERLEKETEKLKGLQIFLDDSSLNNVLSIRSKSRKIQDKHGLGLVIVDYLQLVKGRKSESRQVEVSGISKDLKALAKDLDVPVLALAQLNRKVEDRPNGKPQLADLRNSGAIEQDSDIVMFLYKEKGNDDNIVNAEISKHRNGETGRFQLDFEGGITRFRDFVEPGTGDGWI
ncbi:MAG: replicative DNA helicase [Lentisphaerae bacterium]|nr:replicative DNA helicase [Lentisphaerota bacterium]